MFRARKAGSTLDWHVCRRGAFKWGSQNMYVTLQKVGARARSEDISKAAAQADACFQQRAASACSMRSRPSAIFSNEFV